MFADLAFRALNGAREGVIFSAGSRRQIGVQPLAPKQPNALKRLGFVISDFHPTMVWSRPHGTEHSRDDTIDLCQTAPGGAKERQRVS
ncbi:hypothetical protein [Cupriavidus sp. D39]|uniref:hypothetical protein n=1 Tax=Cupriavidus sp. D39 TaxID=2997877 RepID=UPI0022701246|nr:hypothetical protein [Cupriavidus sp. D39]MCY0856880.1 hypothetical protein [Cupriavidus sp. D39]